jgi:hypothetical protein
VRARRVDQGKRRGKFGDVSPSAPVQHAGRVVERWIDDADLAILLPVGHVDPVTPGNRGARVARAPARVAHRFVDVDEPLAHRDSEEGLGH